jgi:hypothetical protein
MLFTASPSLADMTQSSFSETKHSAESLARFLRTLQMCGRADTLEAYLNATLDWLQMCGASKSQLAEIDQVLAEAEPFLFCDDADRVERVVKQGTALTHIRITIERAIRQKEPERACSERF